MEDQAVTFKRNLLAFFWKKANVLLSTLSLHLKFLDRYDCPVDFIFQLWSTCNELAPFSQITLGLNCQIHVNKYT